MRAAELVLEQAEIVCKDWAEGKEGIRWLDLASFLPPFLIN
jgi:hypothetical protein